MSKSSKWLVAILILALLLRAYMLVLAWQFPDRTTQPDTPSYVQPALNLLSDHAYTYPSAKRTPIYPLFIAAAYGIFGQTPVGVVALQVLVSVATVLLTYMLGTRLFSQKVALLAAFLVAFSVEIIAQVFFVLTETLFTFLCLASILAFVEAWQNGARRWLVASAILMALTVLCRPIGLPLPLLLVCIYLFKQNEAWRSRLYSGIIYLLAFGLVLLPWVVRNKIVVGVATVSTITSASMLYYNASILDANMRDINPSQARQDLSSEVSQLLVARGLPNTEANRYEQENALAQKIILQAPFEYAVLYLKADLNNFLPGVTDLTEILGITQGGKGTANILNREGLLPAIQYYFGDSLWLVWLLLPAIVFLGVTYLGDIISVVSLARQGTWFALALLGAISLYLVLIPGGASLPRFRVPAMPYLSLLAGYGFEQTWNYLRKRAGHPDRSG